MNLNHLIGLAVAVGLVLVGVCLGYLAWGRQGMVVVEKPAAPVWHDDGSLTAMRSPKAKPDLPAPSAPPGGRLVRTVEVTVLPTRQDSQASDEPKNPEQSPDGCQPVTVRLDMHAYDDGLRVSALASGGEVLDAVDIPRARRSSSPGRRSTWSPLSELATRRSSVTAGASVPSTSARPSTLRRVAPSSAASWRTGSE